MSRFTLGLCAAWTKLCVTSSSMARQWMPSRSSKTLWTNTIWSPGKCSSPKPTWIQSSNGKPPRWRSTHYR
eukprot:5378617-Prorocentrum_lima.AAC.1